MKQNIIFIFPGQASQYIGMGKDLYENSSRARAVMDKVTELDGLSHIRELCFEGPADLLTRTDNVQPAITTVSLMALAGLKEAIGQEESINLNGMLKACAGHSLGEYAAYVAAGILSEATVMKLVSWRGRWMNEAAQPPYPTGAMLAVIGIGVGVLQNLVEKLGKDRIALANINSHSQIILSGTREAIFQAEEAVKTIGAKKTVILNVSGAWHSPLMIPAEAKMKELIQSELTPESVSLNGDVLVVANVTANEVKDYNEVKHTLTRQVTSPVNWVDSVQRMCDLCGNKSDGKEADVMPLFVEVGPGRVLRGLMRGIDRKLEVINVDDMEGVENLTNRLRKDN